MNSIIIECKNVCKTYPENKSQIKILKNCNFSINKGEMTAVIGSSGSGKSTLLQILGGLDVPTSGKVIFDGININKLSHLEKSKLRNQKLGFIYQFHHLLSDFTALENVAIPLIIKNINKKKAKQYAYDLLTEIDMNNASKKFPAELSGGERQRIAIARALINKPSLVLADEPTGNLDAENTDIIFNLIKKFNKNFGTTFLIATHDFNLSKKLVKKITIKDGKLLYNSSSHST